jgi:hypothetical protein
MSSFQLDEAELLRLNSVLQRADDVLVTNCLTRTAQESKLFPILPYLDLVMIDSYYRWPDLLRKATEQITPEEIGHRMRESTTTINRLTGWASLNYYLNGRGMLIRNGLIRPEDNLEDLWFMVDYQQRVMRAYGRTSAHNVALDASDINQVHEERVLQVLETDAYEADDKLRRASSRFIAAATQYNFLVGCESRSSLASAGPYSLGDKKLLHTRDFTNMTDCALPWVDDVAPDLPYANLTVAVITDGVRIEITDWGTPYTTPEDYQDGVVGIGLYTGDCLSDRLHPVGMGSRNELIDTFESLTASLSAATRELFSRFANMTNDQMVEAGMGAYLRAPMDAAIMAGTYEQSEWDFVDDRTRRLWDIYNEEYSLDAYVDHFAGMISLRGSSSEYYLHPVSYAIWRRGGGKDPLPAPGRNGHLVPASVLTNDDYSLRVNPNGLEDCRGSWSLPSKVNDKYTFQAGTFTQQQMNDYARAFRSPLFELPWRAFDEASVKYQYTDPDVDAMYQYTQESSRLLQGRGASLRRADLEAIRTEAGERPWSEVSGGRAAAAQAEAVA